MSQGVLEIFETYVPGLKPSAGSNYVGFCPIHGEDPKTSKRSLSVNVETGQWFCFSGCGGGALFTFLKNVTTATKAERAFERVKRSLKKPGARKTTSLSREGAGLFRTEHPLPERILGLFDQLPDELLDDGFEEWVLRDNDIGFDEDLNRVTFPLRDIDGYLAAIAGKRLDGDGPKYKVYTTELEKLGYRGHELDPRKLVWRCDRLYPSFLDEGSKPTTYITEGYKACLWMVQNGYPNTGAIMGSTATDEQLRFLEHLGGTVVLCLDNNEAGLLGTLRTGYKLRGKTRVRVIRYPSENPKLQPDDLSPEELATAVDHAIPLSHFARLHPELVARVKRTTQRGSQWHREA